MPDPDGPDLGAIEHDVARSKRRSRRTLWLSMLLGVLIVFGFGVDKYRNVWAQRRAVAALRQAGGRVWYDFHRSDSSTNYVDARRPAMLRSIESAFGRRFADWLRSIGAEDLFGEVVEVSVSHKPNLTDEDLRFLKDLPDLKTLFLSGGAVTPNALEYLANHRFLEDVSLGIEMTDDDLHHLAEITSLRELYLMGPRPGDYIVRLQGSSTIDFNEYDSRVTAEGVKRLSTALPDCRISY